MDKSECGEGGQENDRVSASRVKGQGSLERRLHAALELTLNYVSSQGSLLSPRGGGRRRLSEIIFACFFVVYYSLTVRFTFLL